MMDREGLSWARSANRVQSAAFLYLLSRHGMRQGTQAGLQQGYKRISEVACVAKGSHSVGCLFTQALPCAARHYGRLHRPNKSLAWLTDPSTATCALQRSDKLPTWATDPFWCKASMHKLLHSAWFLTAVPLSCHAPPRLLLLLAAAGGPLLAHSASSQTRLQAHQHKAGKTGINRMAFCSLCAGQLPLPMECACSVRVRND